jgi:hypothetical protein
MGIKREGIDGRKVDFSAVNSGRRLPPSQILRDEFLTPISISVYELANAIKVSVFSGPPRPSESSQTLRRPYLRFLC